MRRGRSLEIIATDSDGQGFEKPQGYSVKGMEGRGKGMDIETLQKPLPLTRGTEVIEVWYSKKNILFL